MTRFLTLIIPVASWSMETVFWLCFVGWSLLTLLIWAFQLVKTNHIHGSWTMISGTMALATGACFLSLIFSSHTPGQAIVSLYGPIPFLSAAILLFCTPPLMASLRSIPKQMRMVFRYAPILLLVGIAGVRLILPYKTPSLPILTGARIMLQSWDTLPHTLVGAGIERFTDTYLLYRPQSLNLTPHWSIKYTVNSSLMLHIGSTMGCIGILSFLSFLLSLWIKQRKSLSVFIETGIITVIAFFAPLSFAYFPLIILWILTSDTLVQRRAIPQKRTYGISLISVLIVCILGTALVPWYQGEVFFSRALQAIQREDGSQAFLLLSRAIQANPTNPLYRISMSQTAMHLSNSVVQNAPVESDGPMSAENTNQMLHFQLRERSVQEAKIALRLNPESASAWANLADIYTKQIGEATHAESFAYAAYRKALALDPTNPTLPLILGTLYLDAGMPVQAFKEIQQSIRLKTNYREAWSTLSSLYQTLGDWDNALKALEHSLSLTAKGSEEESVILQEIMVVEEKKRQHKPLSQ